MNELREEVELPAIVEYFKRSEEERVAATERVCIGGKEAGIAFFTRHPHLGFSCAVHLQCELSEREEQLKSSLAANREQKAEIERLTALNKQLHEANFRQAAKINSIVGARAEFADTLLKLFGYTMYTEEYENASIVDEVKAAIVRADKAEAELASLRASVGEKWIDVKQELPPFHKDVLVSEIGSERCCYGHLEMDGLWWRVDGSRHIFHDTVAGWQPLPAPPTLPGEEK